jgi:hypothetical protein
MSMALSRTPSDPNELFLYGTTTPVGRPGESWWDGERQALKQNELVWARSTDGGRTWTRPTVIPMPIPGSAEAPGPLTVTSGGRWIACYAPYNTFDPRVVVDRNQIVAVLSDDEGRSWRHTSMLRFDDPQAGGAEAWVIELDEWPGDPDPSSPEGMRPLTGRPAKARRLVGTCWSMCLATGVDTPIPYAISHDEGTTWTPTRSTGITGQATSLAPAPPSTRVELPVQHSGSVQLPSRVYVAYNQRAQPEPGVWLAIARPEDDEFDIERLGPAWLAEQATHVTDGDAGHDAWTDFAFGEPSVTPLWNGDVLVTLWCDQPSGRGIRFVRLAGASIHGWAVSAGVSL